MTSEIPPFHRQFNRVEARYKRAANQGWYRADLGTIAPFVQVPVWVYSTWAPFDVNLSGSRSDEYVVLIDNSYVGSFAYNLTKIQLGAFLFPEQDDYSDLMVGNIKKFIAEQQYLTERSGENMQWILEYLMEYNGRNRALDARFRLRSDGLALLHLLSTCATFGLLLHEVGHIAYGLEDYKLRQRATIDQHINAVLGVGRKLDRLDEEVFCDVFAMVNLITVVSQDDGWNIQDVARLCLHSLLGALLCVKTRDIVLAASKPGETVALEPTKDLLMARYEVTARVVREVLPKEEIWFQTARRSVAFPGDELDLRARWFDALDMPVRDPETRNLATIIAGAFANSTLGGFDHVMRSLNQMLPITALTARD